MDYTFLANNIDVTGNTLTVTVTNISKGVKCYFISYNYEETGSGSDLSDCDLALTNTPVALSFDLYNNSDAQTINYTTSSTGEVSVVNSDYASFVVNQTAKTITVTPIAVTNGAQTITVNQAADETYDTGSATFTVTIGDSTPFTGGDVTFDATVDTGTSPLTKNEVTFACDNGVLNNESEYRMYKNSTTTFSISNSLISQGYKIKSIAFTGVSGNPASGFASQTGWTTDGNNGTWTGEAQSVSFEASGAQVRATQIVVTVEKPKTLSSIAITTPPTKTTYTEGETFDPTGMVVTATYTDETTAPVTDYTFTPDGALSTTDTQVTISYTLSDVTKTATQAITVNALPAYTVTLGDDNSTLAESDGGVGVTLPSRNAIGDYTFAGWSDTNVADETTTAPTIVAAGTYHPTANVTLYPVYTRTEGSATTETATVSISDYATNNSWESGTQYNTVDIDDNVTATASGGGNTGKYYTNGNDWRFYQNEQAEVIIATTPNGTLNSVKFVFTVSNSGTLNYGGHVVESGTAVNVSGNTAEFTVGNSGTATNGQVRISAIEVNYTIGNETKYYWSNPCETVSISSAGLATFCSQYALDFTDITDVWAYIAKYENDKVTYHRVKKVPANTGLLLRNKLETGAISCDVPFLTINADDVTGNMFIGTLEDINALASVDGTNTNYILNNGANGVGFYKANNKKVGAGKAYLQLPTEGAKTFIGFEEEGEATSISTMDNGQLTMDNVYNLQGQKVGSEYKGIVIVNGKKFINK